MSRTLRLGRRDAGLFLAALLLRAAHAWREGLALPLVGDAYEYGEYARNLVESGFYLGPEGALATRMPGYPLFLALIRLVHGDSLSAVIAAQCVLGALTCVLLYRLAQRLLPETWALSCGAAAVLYFDLIAPAALPLSESLYSFLLVLSFWALYNAAWSPTRRALTYGALSGGLYLVRPEPLPYILALCVALPRLFPKFGRREVAAALAAVALTTGLWVGRNALVFHRLLPASSVGQNVKYLSLLLPAERMGLVPEGRYEAPASLSELEREADMARAYRKLAARLSWTQIAKAYVFNLASILYPFLPGYDWTYVFVLPFFLLGLREAVRRKEFRPMAAAVLCSISVLIFFGGPASRYRQGVSPFIVLLSMAGMKAAYDTWGGVRFRFWTGAWIGSNLLIGVFQTQARQLALWLRAVSWGVTGGS